MRRSPLWLVVALSSLAAGCGRDDAAVIEPSADDGVRIASFNFAESVLLAELYTQAIEARGLPVIRLGEVGPREIVAPAMELGRIDLVPEYLGTALDRLGAPAPSPNTDIALTELVERLRPLGLTALDVAPAEDKNVVVVTRELAQRAGLVRISDLVGLAGDLRFGGPAECPERPLCLVGLEQMYGLTFAEFVQQPSQRFAAEALRRDEIDVALMFSTDSALSDPDLVTLDDDRGLQPAENIVPVVRADALDRWGPELAAALDELSGSLTTIELRRLNERVGGDEPVDIVATEWLVGVGILAPP